MAANFGYYYYYMVFNICILKIKISIKIRCVSCVSSFHKKLDTHDMHNTPIRICYTVFATLVLIGLLRPLHYLFNSLTPFSYILLHCNIRRIRYNNNNNIYKIRRTINLNDMLYSCCNFSPLNHLLTILICTRNRYMTTYSEVIVKN